MWVWLSIAFAVAGVFLTWPLAGILATKCAYLANDSGCGGWKYPTVFLFGWIGVIFFCMLFVVIAIAAISILIFEQFVWYWRWAKKKAQV